MGTSNHNNNKIKYVEVLGDTVYGKHMGITIITSVVLGLGGFLLGKLIFPGIAAENMINSYSLLLGIGGLVIALFINSFLFKPKRILIEEENTPDKLHHIYKEYQFDLDAEREAIKNDPIVEKEMKEQGIHHMFFQNEEVTKK